MKSYKFQIAVQVLGSYLFTMILNKFLGIPKFYYKQSISYVRTEKQ